jgi:adenylate cyclase
MRATGRGRWPKNPNYCAICFRFLERRPGGAEVNVACMFADVRGSTALGEKMTPREFSQLLNRFYEIAAREVVTNDGIVDKFVGDEIVAFFVRGMAGPDFVRSAVQAAVGILRATGHASKTGPWLPVGEGRASRRRVRRDHR